jgi:hypothetical protein
VTDPISTSKSARESLARGLNALQADPTVPPQLVELAAPIAQAMGALHQIERTQQLVPHADVALNHVRGALSQLQARNANHPAVNQALEAVATSLSLVHALSQMANAPAPAQQAAPQQPPPQPAQPHTHEMAAKPVPPPAQPQAYPAPAQQQAYAPPAQQQAYPPPAPQQAYAPPAQQQAYPPPGQAYVPPAPQQAYVPSTQQQAYAPPAQQQQPRMSNPQPSFPQGAPHGVQGSPPGQPAHSGASPMVARDPFAPPQASPAQAAQPAAGPGPAARPPSPSMPVPSPPAGNLAPISADLGAHSVTNFYKGLSGNDIIDHGGLFVSTYILPKLNAPVRLKVSLPGGYEFEANATVKWTREDGGADAPPGFGAQFTEITAEARQLVYRYVRNREPIFHDDF